MKRAFDIAIAGCGPAGLASALFLHRQGHRVTLYDQFEAPRPVGSGLMIQPTGLAVMKALGLDLSLCALGEPIECILGKTAPGDRKALIIDFVKDGAGFRQPIAVHRAALFNVLYDAVKAADIEIVTGFQVVRRLRDGIQWRLADAAGDRSAPADFIVDGLGARSPLLDQSAGPVKQRPLPYGALWASLDWRVEDGFAANTLAQRYRRACNMVGVLPVGRIAPGGAPQVTFFWSLKPETHDDWRSGGLRRWKDEVCGIWPESRPLLDQIGDPDQLVLASYTHHTLAVPHGEGICFVGDSAHSTSPQLGQGANMALLDAAALAKAMAGADDPEAAFCQYRALRRLHVRLYQGMSHIFTPFYQSDSRSLPWIRDGGFAIASRLPGGAKLLTLLVAGLIADPLGKLDLA